MIFNIPMLFGKLNSHANFIHRSHMALNNPFLTYWHFVSTNQEKFTSECPHLYRNKFSNYVWTYTSHSHYLKHIIFLLSGLFSSAVRVPRQCLVMCRQWQYVSRHIQMCLHIYTMSRCVYTWRHAWTISRYMFWMPMVLSLAPLHSWSHSD